MKVLDLQCNQGHLFEGWFTSEDDFAGQKESGVLICPVCGDSRVNKRLSAPRLNLRSSQVESASASAQRSPGPDDRALALQSAWIEMGRHVVANTEDVGDRFVQEARKIHYGEVPERGIRGQATLKETESLIEEGIVVVPLPLFDGVKQTLH
jgi:hypothetical protein